MSSLRIAIVEDEEVAARRLARLVGEILDERRHRLHHLSTLDSALAQMGARPFDLLFLDLNLYGRDGFQLLRKAVAQPFHTIVVSAHTDRAVEAFERALAFEPDGVDEAQAAAEVEGMYGVMIGWIGDALA